MTTLLVFVWAAAAIFLVIILAMRPERSRHSLSELRRLEDKAALRREKLLGDVLALRRIVTGLLLIGLVLAGSGAWQTTGVLVTVGFWMLAGSVSRLKFVRKLSMKLYG